MSSLSPLAERLVTARKGRRQAAYAPSLLPVDNAAAYAVQAEVAGALGTIPAGWKVGLIPGGGAFGAPILACDLMTSGATYGLAPDMGGVKVEAELAVRLARDLPPRPGKPYTRADILDAVGEVFVGIELVATRFNNVEDAPFAAKLADNFNNGAYVVGGGTKTFKAIDLSQIRCRLSVDGEITNDRLGGHGDSDPLVPVVAWASAQCDLLGGLKAGQFITTGTLNVPVALDRAARLEASLEGVGTVSVAVVMRG
ncbi:fumarylacetoacetate hydrolase family protein [Roseiarcaceae bacterium H3SJ34-1]|uniref:2-keto-4-pentenoate hydratase n=1 Tax=Terripilifer ovatus TaxID=3032367 RepID=UPI003AB920C2|nr:fumarylacetoacetate hydrolase family protein [Roseiarcaceae bacterium H3SJ34-1]